MWTGFSSPIRLWLHTSEVLFTSYLPHAWCSGYAYGAKCVDLSPENQTLSFLNLKKSS